MSECVAIVLSGGKSKRFRKTCSHISDKALYSIDGIPMIAKIINSLRRCVDRVILSVDTPEKIQNYSKFVKIDGYVVDDKFFKGPLSGIYSTINSIEEEKMIFLPNDMPYLESDLIKLVIKILDRYDVVSPILPNGLIETTVLGLNSSIVKNYLTLIRDLGRNRIADIHRGTPKVYLLNPLKHKFQPSNFININRLSDTYIKNIDYPEGEVVDDIILKRDFSFEDVRSKNITKLKNSLWKSLFTKYPYEEVLFYLEKGIYMLVGYSLLDSYNIFSKELGKLIIKNLKPGLNVKQEGS